MGIRFRVVIRKLTVDKEQDVTSGREHPWRQRVGNSLLERMRKPMAPQFPGGYVIKPGMRYEQARSIFHAAGANYASDLHNKHYPDLTYQGFVLPDGSCVYLRVTPRGDQPQTIVSIGLGPHDRGYDPKWNWRDEKANSKPSLKLKPLTDYIPQ